MVWLIVIEKHRGYLYENYEKIICVMIILIQVAFVIASASDIKELIATKTETPVYIDNHLLKKR